MPEARGSGQEELPHVQGAAAVRAQEGREELPLAGGQGRRPRALGCNGPGAAKRSYPRPEARGGNRVLGCDGAGSADRSYPMPETRSSGQGSYPAPRSGAMAWRRYLTPEARGSGREELPHGPRSSGCRAQEGQEELLHVQGQEGRP